MYSVAVVERALAGLRAGDVERPDGTGEAGNPACGDAVRIQLQLADGRVLAARRRAFGCPHAVAAAELACELAEGRSLLDAARIGTADLEPVLEPAEGTRECVALAVDALHEAIAACLERDRLPPAEDRVAVAMSGGVDSAVAMLKTVEAGLRPVGVTLRLWIDPQAPASDRACCSPASVRAARAACHALGVPHVTLDLRDDFRAEVVEGFVAAHAAGRTPNPCMRCNGAFRFHALAAFADRVGAARLVTGHYARLERREGRPLVARAADDTKDQSYMLAGVPPEILARVWFPLGDQAKTATRAEARAAGLEAAERRESQEVCFVGGGDHRSFVERMGGAGPAGAITDARGQVLGRHSGVHRFTPGQRRGLGISSRLPLYVLETDAGSGRVTVGGREELARRTVTVSPGSLFAPAARVQAKLRYRSPAVPATVRVAGEGFLLELDEPVYGVAPGQAAVLYDGAAVVGVGTIAG
ncbi:MAG TPA: tRNA 2-thiouridine(34) synthase MnmA [Gaiellales bacterium]|nr:tRNA 2-thiouridine(34) synthase MnmA [Gaiellales bacterium]